MYILPVHCAGQWSTITRVLPFWACDCAWCRINKEHDFDHPKHGLKLSKSVRLRLL